MGNRNRSTEKTDTFFSPQFALAFILSSLVKGGNLITYIFLKRKQRENSHKWGIFNTFLWKWLDCRILARHTGLARDWRYRRFWKTGDPLKPDRLIPDLCSMTHITRSQQPLLRKEWHMGISREALNWPLVDYCQEKLLAWWWTMLVSHPNPHLVNSQHPWLIDQLCLFLQRTRNTWGCMFPSPQYPLISPKDPYPVTDRYAVRATKATDSGRDSPETTSYQSPPTLKPWDHALVWRTPSPPPHPASLPGASP